MRVHATGMHSILAHLTGNELLDSPLLHNGEGLLVIVSHDENAKVALILILYMRSLPRQFTALPHATSRVDGVVIADVTPGATGKMPTANPFKPRRS